MNNDEELSVLRDLILLIDRDSVRICDIPNICRCLVNLDSCNGSYE
jgi:hypothetical protein